MILLMAAMEMTDSSGGMAMILCLVAQGMMLSGAIAVLIL